MDKITIDSPLDMHLHIRDGEMMENIIRYSTTPFSGALIMPNTIPPLTSRQEILDYRDRILKAKGEDSFEPYMSVFFKSSYDYDFLKSIKDIILVVKLYPSGVTTNSEGGVVSVNLDEVGDTLSAMEKLGIPLSIHGETMGTTFEREAEFLPTYELLAKTFPRLKIIMEHISDRRTVRLLDKYPNLYATVTLHHLTITLDDLLGGALKPHLFCKPIVKTSADRDALQKLVLSGNPKVMFGSDSAPHPQDKKENQNGSAGIFSAPTLLQGIVELFDKNGKLDLLQNYLSDNAKRIYGVNPPKKLVTLEKKEMKISESYGGVIPMLAGETLSWSLV